MSFEILPFVPTDAVPADFAGFHELTVAAIEADRPDAARPTQEDVIAELRSPLTGPGPSLFWTARRAGHLVGMAAVHLPDAENTHIATTRITVDPAFRGQGIGTAMLCVVLPQLRRHEREIVSCHGLTAGSAAESWAIGRGFTVVHRRVLQQLEVARCDPALWQVDAPTGYQVELWSGSAPEHLVASFAHARGAIRDAPEGDSSFQLPQWDARRVREEEQDWANRGFEYLVAAVCDDAAQVVGLTELVLHPGRPTEGLQQYTAVLPHHRGLGLGRAMKAALMRWLVVNRPHIASISTATGAENSHTIRMNHQLGYITTRSMITVEAALSDLERRLCQDE